MADGLADLRRACRRFPDKVHDALAEAVLEEARDIRRDEKRAVPVDTGELRDSIDYRLHRDGLGATIGVSDPSLWWAIWIEWGRKNADAQPFATPTAERARRRWPKRAQAAVREVARAQR